MKRIKNILSFSILTLLLFSACDSEAQQNKEKSSASKKSTVQVIQFHSEHRCMTCKKIESLTRETLKSYPGLTLALVNVEEEKNEKKAEEFEAAGTALFLYDPATGKKKNLTDFAFMNAGNEEKFRKGLKKEIDAFLKS